MKSSQSAHVVGRKLGNDLDAFTWNSPAVSSPTARRKRNNKSKTFKRDVSAPILSSTLGGESNVRIVQENNFMGGHSVSASSLQAPVNVGTSNSDYGSDKSAASKESASKEDSEINSSLSEKNQLIFHLV